MQRIGPATVLSALLHVGLFLLLFLGWTSAPKPVTIASVPVQLVSSVPMHEQAAAPVDELAVKTPAPEPAPEEPVKPEPTPEPAPKLPVPVPQKQVVKPEPVKTPEPPKPTPPKPEAKPAPAAPDKNGLKKPQPQTPDKNAKSAPAKPSLDLNALSQLAAAPSKARTRQQAQANTHKTDGTSNFGSAPQDAGQADSLQALAALLGKLWNPSCDVAGADQVQIQLRFTLSPNGRVIQGPDWLNRRDDPLWEAGAARAIQAVKRGEPYTDLPANAYSKPIPVLFDAKTACGNRG